ncbi:hypothetical protein [Anaerotignum sp. MB30-C6]|uniref:hypothetical protein n=1 Tax=Anaerotignum sp. MB30-C6 TaxID=3070814 RepID=UPI0027DC19DE|nr:hypothetical protein [Anaerotignum sp. MB30-C6]WMI81357.1 hypothetical protein RBQ60_01100 [Anaerotignum sp. MB30-C6]
MEPKRRKHYRVCVKDVHPTPEQGIYVTKDEANQICAYGIILFIILAILAILPRK